MLKRIMIISLFISLFSCSFSTTSNSINDEKIKNLAVNKVQITSGDNLVISEGNRIYLNASVIYENNSRDSAINWSSSDNTIAVINSSSGSLSGVNSGVVTIIATALKDISKKAFITVTIKKEPILESIVEINPSGATLKVGETMKFNGQLKMSDGTVSPNIEWKSDNKDVASVSNGLVIAVGVGTTNITAIASGDYSKRASAKIIVYSELISDSIQKYTKMKTNL